MCQHPVVPTHRPTSTRRITGLLATTLLIGVSGCSLLDGEEEASGPTPSTIVIAETVEVSALDAILPQATAFGPEFTLGDSDIWSSGDDEEAEDDTGVDLDAAFEKSCPGFEQAFDSIGSRFETQPSVERGFAAPDGRAFMVGTSSHADNVIDAAQHAAMTEAMEVVALCPTAQVTGENGLQTNVTVDARTVDGYGEWAMALEVRLSMLHPNLPEPITMTIDYLYLGVGSVTVGIFTADGLDPTTMVVAQADRAKRDAVAANLSMMAASLQMATPPTT